MASEEHLIAEIKRVFGDTSVTSEETLHILLAAQSEIETLILILESEQ